MRANAATREPEIQRFWAEQQIYEHLAEHNPGDPFVLHDGPVYANGTLHVGHAMNRVLKDVINKFQLLQGRKVRYVPGWDCHGLPVELKVLQNLKPEEKKNLTPLEIRHKARDFALATIAEQKQSFCRYGIWGNWDQPYVTLNPAYEAAQIEVFGQMVLKGHIYRGLKPVYWSPSSKTALAEAELEYPEGHTSRSIYVGFPMIAHVDMPDAIRPFMQEFGDLKVAIWTTTPWTIPANLGVSVNPQLDYAVVEVGADFQPRTKYLLVAAEAIERLAATLNTTLTIQATLPGKDLEHLIYRHPLYDRESPILLGGDWITTDSGTGLVHTAPGHGQEDYLVGQRYELPLLSPVDDDGNFTSEAGQQFQGLNVLKEGNTAVIEALTEAGALLKEEAYAHKYPYDWRTKKPVIYRATEQWFVSIAGFRDDALKAIGDVRWIPAQGENRITPMVSERSDWCISRQRSWGVPIPVFYDNETGEPLLNAETIAHIQNLIAQHGSDIWWERSTEELLPASYQANGRTYRKGTDIMDVWFDSGSSWAAVLLAGKGVRSMEGGVQSAEGDVQSAECGVQSAEGEVQSAEGDVQDVDDTALPTPNSALPTPNSALPTPNSALTYPADMYLEGSDQHRGWFQSSLLTSVAINGHAPYKTVLTHGFALDEQGRKMSKSLGNIVDPMMVINGGKNQKEEPPYGADVLRLWVSSVDYTADVLIGKTILKQLADVYRKIRNTARFLLGNLHDFNPATDVIAYDRLPEIDRYMLHRSTEVFTDITDAFQSFQFFRFFQTVQNFCVVDLSNFYLDAAKDRLYISAPAAVRRRSCQTVMYHVLENLVRSIAPVLCHMAEDIWQALPYETAHRSVFAAGWVTLDPQWQQPSLSTTWNKLRDLRTEVNKVLEQARAEKAIGSSLEAKVLLYTPDTDLRQQLQTLNPLPSTPHPLPINGVDELRYLFITSQVEVLDTPDRLTGLNYSAQNDTFTIGVLKADGSKCDRCWNYATTVGQSEEHPLLCDRCVAALAGEF